MKETLGAYQLSIATAVVLVAVTGAQRLRASGRVRPFVSGAWPWPVFMVCLEGALNNYYTLYVFAYLGWNGPGSPEEWVRGRALTWAVAAAIVLSLTGAARMLAGERTLSRPPSVGWAAGLLAVMLDVVFVTLGCGTSPSIWLP